MKVLRRLLFRNRKPQPILRLHTRLFHIRSHRIFQQHKNGYCRAVRLRFP